MRSRSFGEHRRESVQAGLTLLELMLVLVLLGVLSVYAVVSYREQLLGAQRALGISELHVLEARQARFRLRYGRYAAALSELGLGEAAYGIDARGRHVERDNKRRIYLFELSTTPNGHAFVATPQLCGAVGRTSRPVRAF